MTAIMFAIVGVLGVLVLYLRRIIYEDGEILPGHSFELYNFDIAEVPVIWRTWYYKSNRIIYEEKSEIGLDVDTEFWREIKVSDNLVAQIAQLRNKAVLDGYRELKSSDYQRIVINIIFEANSLLEFNVDRFVQSVDDLLEDSHLGTIEEANLDKSEFSLDVRVLAAQRARDLIVKELDGFFKQEAYRLV